MNLNKWIGLSMTGLIILSGCAVPETDSENIDTEASAKEEVGEETREVVWTVEPTIILSNVEEMEALPVHAEIENDEYIGYPQQWNHTDYSGNAVLVQKYGLYGVMDYDGNLLQDCQFQRYDHYNMGPEWSPSMFLFDLSYFLSHDYKEISPAEGLGGAMGFKTADIYVEDGVLHLGYDYGGGMQYSNTNNTGGRILADLRSGGENIGFAVVDADSSVIEEYEGLDGVFFANGYIKYGKNGKYGLIKVGEGKLTEAVYDDMKYMEDGFIPVYRNGKWGFLNEKGEEVTDFMFEYASSVYQGKAFVELQGVYGILNLAETIKQGIPVNEDTCKVSEEGLEAKEEAGDMSKIGLAIVRVDGLRIRKGPSTDAEQTGRNVNNGDEFYVFEIVEDDEYTWYRIGEEMWIASDGTWVELTPGE